MCRGREKKEFWDDFGDYFAYLMLNDKRPLDVKRRDVIRICQSKSLMSRWLSGESALSEKKAKEVLEYFGIAPDGYENLIKMKRQGIIYRENFYPIDALSELEWSDVCLSYLERHDIDVSELARMLETQCPTVEKWLDGRKPTPWKQLSQSERLGEMVSEWRQEVGK